MTVEHSGRPPRPRRETEVQIDRIRSLWPELLAGFEAMRPGEAIIAVMKRVDFRPAPELFPKAYRRRIGFRGDTPVSSWGTLLLDIDSWVRLPRSNVINAPANGSSS